VIGIGAIVFDFALILTATTAPITVAKPLAITTSFPYLKGVNRIGFNRF